jgi:hypothetical protein
MSQIDKKDFWPKEGKLKKGLIILGIVVAGALLITLLEEKTSIKLAKRVPFIIALACIGVWLYKPSQPKDSKPIK